MNKILNNLILTCILMVLFSTNLKAADLFVDFNNGDDNNIATHDQPLKSIEEALRRFDKIDSDQAKIILMPGIYYIDHTIHIKLESENANQRKLSIEALYLPDDDEWSPELMPVVLCAAKADTSFNFIYCSVGLMIEVDHVAIRGIKFTGNPYPHIPCYPIARENREVCDLEVSQCMFVGNTDASYIQVGVIAHGDKTAIRHCVFFGCGNAVVFWQTNKGKKLFNEVSNSIIYNCENGIWCSDADSAFVFRNNIVSNCEFPFVKNDYNNTIYEFENSLFVENKNYTGKWTTDGIVPVNYELVEKNVTKNGTIEFIPAKRGSGIIEKRYLHPAEGLSGFEIGVGLFQK